MTQTVESPHSHLKKRGCSGESLACCVIFSVSLCASFSMFSESHICLSSFIPTLFFMTLKVKVDRNKRIFLSFFVDERRF